MKSSEPTVLPGAVGCEDSTHPTRLRDFYSDDVLGISMATMKEEWRIKDLSAPHVVRYGPLGKHMFVTCKKASGVAIIDPENRKLVKFFPLTVNPRSLTFSSDESRVFCGS